MTGPGETRLRQQIKEARDMGEVGFETDDPANEGGFDYDYDFPNETEDD